MPHNFFPSQFNSNSYISFSACVMCTAFLFRGIWPQNSLPLEWTWFWWRRVSRGQVCVLMECSHIVLSAVEVVDWRVLQLLWGRMILGWYAWMIFLCEFFHESKIMSFFCVNSSGMSMHCFENFLCMYSWIYLLECWVHFSIEVSLS